MTTSSISPVFYPVCGHLVHPPPEVEYTTTGMSAGGCYRVNCPVCQTTVSFIIKAKEPT